MQIPYIRNEVDGIVYLTLFLGGVPTPIDGTHPAFNEIDERRDTITPQEVRELLDTTRRVRRQLARFGNVSVDGDTVYYKGEAVHGLLAQRMLKMLDDGQDIRPWALFLENLQANPAKHAVDELYGWLEHANMPITERGNFLAYKKVKDDYTSYHRNSDGSEFHNDIGTFVSMQRNKVDDNRNRTCSSGLHFCSWDYLGSYYGGSGKVVILEINPAHVVSIPTDYSNAKGRAEGYLIVGEIPQEECKHAFPGLSYVGYDDSDYITYRQSGDIDYSSIDDGWYNDYACVDADKLDDNIEIAYNMGHEEGYEDGYNYEVLDLSLSEWDFDTNEEFEAYSDGYRDGFYAGDEDRDNDDADYWEEDEDNLDLTPQSDDELVNMLRAMGFVVIADIIEPKRTVEEVKAKVDPKLWNTPQSSRDDYSIESLADDINSGRLTLKEVIRDFNLSGWEQMQLINKLD